MRYTNNTNVCTKNKTKKIGSVPIILYIEPTDFNPAQFVSSPSHYLYLHRRINDHEFYSGPNGNENHESLACGSDDSLYEYRDDDPSPNGNIYDLDTPGIDLLNPLDSIGTIVRNRENFEQYARWGSETCSDILEWYVAQSIKKVGPEETGDVSSATANTLSKSSSWATHPTGEPWIFVKITSGPGVGQVRAITNINGNTITIKPDWEDGEIPDNTSDYKVICSSTWQEETGITGDNKADEG